MPTKIENVCKCGASTFGTYPIWDDPHHIGWAYQGIRYNEEVEETHCPVCGWFLHKNGFAYEMVRAEELAVRDLALENAIADYPMRWEQTPEEFIRTAREWLSDNPADEGSDE